MQVQINKFRSEGFTLVEVLLALAVLVIAASGAARVVSDAYSHVAITEQYQRAHYLADSHIRSLSLQQLTAGVTKGVYAQTEDQSGLPWVLRLEPLAVNDMPAANSNISEKVKALRAELLVELPEQARSIRISTLLLVEPDAVAPSTPALIEMAIKQQETRQ